MHARIAAIPAASARLGSALRIALGIHCLIAFAPPAASGNAPLAATDADAARFPLSLREALGPTAHVLDFDAAAHAASAAREQVRWSGVPLPGGAVVDLELVRWRPSGETQVAVDGAVAPGRSFALDAAVWKGHVAGEAECRVFLVVSRHGAYGYLFSRAGHFSLTTAPAAAGMERRILLRRIEPDEPSLPFRCDSTPLATPAPPTPEAGPPPATPAEGGAHFVARVAVETDYQYFQLFPSLEEAQLYCFAVLAGVSATYEEQLSVAIEVPYVGLHTSEDDGWEAPDLPFSNPGAILDEFKAAWQNGKAPVPAHLHHFLSGISHGGGVANVDGLCSPLLGFGVSTGIALFYPFVVPAPYFYHDFVVVAHELGHNFGSPHTHEFCPPLDQCATPLHFGPCQDVQICQMGTLMSYCHLCGSISNIAPEFHPVVAQLLRAEVLASCLPLVGTPLLCLDAPSKVEVSTTPGGKPAPFAIAVQHCDASGVPIPWKAEVAGDAPWLTLSSAGGTALLNESTEVTVSLDPTKAQPGSQHAKVRVYNVLDSSNEVVTKVTLAIGTASFQLGDTLEGALATFNEKDEARFFGLAGSAVRFRALPGPNGTEAKIQVRAPGGAKVAKLTVLGFDDDEVETLLPETGEYELLVKGLSFSTGSYTIETELLAPPAAALPQVLEETQKGKKDFVQFSFLALPGTYLDAAVSLPEPLAASAYLSLKTPEGAVIELPSQPGKTGPLVEAIPLLVGGKYRLRVHGLSKTGATVTLALNLTAPESDAKVLID